MWSGQVGPIKLDFAVYNASGVRDTSQEELNELMASEAGAMVAKSSTFESRIGNPHPRYWSDGVVSTNSTGLANHGYEYYLNYGHEIAETKTKPYFISIATLTLPELGIMIERANQCPGVDGIEFNFSCPNIVGKRQVGYDLVETEKLLQFISARCTKPFGLKLPPYFEPLQIEETARVIKKYPVSFLVCINSLGNGLLLQQDQPCIVPKGGLGGIGGPSLKPFGLANVREFHRHLPDISLVGCGGISTGQDIYEYFLCGASAVEVGTCLYEEGPGCFPRMKQELQKILKEKKVDSLWSIRGELK